MRLVGIPGLNSTGRIEVLYNGSWGTICNRYFTNKDANVICEQLGYSGLSNFKAPFTSGTGPIWLDKVQCTGYEASIAICQNNGWGNHSCSHDQDVGITCSDGTSIYDVAEYTSFNQLGNFVSNENNV